MPDALDRWRRADTIFSAALDLPTEARAAFLDQACAGDDELRREVEHLFEADEKAQQFLEDREAWFEAPRLPEPEASGHPATTSNGWRAGPYRLLGKIGDGGMGIVYLAERADGLFRQRVALKLVRRGVASDEAVRRFRLERQILAGLQHPNIARLLDGGVTEDGTPYFAMEYIAGTPIDKYCDERRLPVAERLKLFCTVCEAVQYAHRNLIVHRDLKPSNILVTDDGTVKLLDFGIAKLLDPDAHGVSVAETKTGLLLMTPEYASPEQVAAETITTASDVYQLGVLLYELLTGHRPYRLPSRLLHEVERIICEEKPERPSTAIGQTVEVEQAGGGTRQITPEHVSRVRATTPERLRRRLAGDLDNIVLKALRKEPARRYASVEQLAEDIRRHRARLPVRARPDTFPYRASRFLRRNWAVVATSATFVVLVSVFAIFMVQERIRSDALSRLLIPTIYAAGAMEEPRLTPFLNWERLDASTALIRKELRDLPVELAWTLAQLSSVYNHNGWYEEAGSLAEEALAMQRQTLGPDHPDVAMTLRYLGNHHNVLGDYEAADTFYRQALDIRRKNYGVMHHFIAVGLGDVANNLQDMDSLDAAEPFYREGLAMYGTLYGETHPFMASQRRGLGWFFYEKGNYEAADTLLQQSLDVAETSRDSAGRAMETSEILSLLGLVRRAQGNYDAAEAYLREAVDIRQNLLGAEHSRTAQIMNNLGWILQEKGDLDEAEHVHRLALDARRKGLDGPHPHIIESLHNLAFTLLRKNETVEAESLLVEALGLQRQRSDDDHAAMAMRLYALGKIHHKKGDLASADSLFREALTHLQTPDADPLLKAFTHLRLGMVLMDRDAAQSADSLLREALSILRQTVSEDHWYIALAQSQLGGCLMKTGRHAEAEPLLQAGYTRLKDARGEDDEYTVQAAAYLAALPR